MALTDHPSLAQGPVLVLIPARGGSKGVPGKNVRPVGGVPLVGRAARTARLALSAWGGGGHRVVCSTDDDAIAAAARVWGAEVPFRRPAELATDTAGSVDVALHALDALGGAGFAALVLVQATTPLLEPGDLAGALKLFFEGGRSPVATVSPAHHPFWTFRLDEGRLAPAAPGAEVERRQDAAPCFALNGAAYVIAPEELRRTRRFVEPGRTRAFVMPAERGIDVDEPGDLARCEAVLEAAAPRPLTVGDRRIGPGQPCFVIAEGGVNHNGDVGLAHTLVDVAVEAGADCIKFQTFRPESLAAAEAPLAAYQERSGETSGSQQAMLARLVLSEAAHRELKQHAEERGLVFLSSPFDQESADFLDALGVPAFKVPSGETVNHPFLAHLARKGRPMLVSTGMCTMAEVAGAVDAIRAAGDPPLALFHCVSNYPAEPAEANLRAMATLRRGFGVPVGWSDHTVDLSTSLAAAALGAAMIERHLTTDKTLPGPDHRASLEGAEFAAMVRQVRAIESALGTGDKVPMPSEAPIAAVARKSLHWSSALLAGTRVAAEHLASLRPGTGLSPAHAGSLLGRSVRRDVRRGEIVREEDMEPVS